MNEDLDILMTGFFPYALELKFSAVQMSGKSWADALSNFLGSAIASYPQKLQYMVASGDRSCRNKSAAKHFQKFFFCFVLFCSTRAFFCSCWSMRRVSWQWKSAKKNISLQHLIKILLPYQAPNKTPTLLAIPEKHKLIWIWIIPSN